MGRTRRGTEEGDESAFFEGEKKRDNEGGRDSLESLSLAPRPRQRENETKKKTNAQTWFRLPKCDESKMAPARRGSARALLCGEGGRERERERVDKEERRPAAGSSSSSLPTPPLSLQPPQTLSAKKKLLLLLQIKKPRASSFPPISPLRVDSLPHSHHRNQILSSPQFLCREESRRESDFLATLLSRKKTCFQTSPTRPPREP